MMASAFCQVERPFQVYLAVFGDQVMDVGAGIRDNGARRQRGHNTAFHFAGFGGKRRRAADKALAALGQVCAQHEVQLAACAADVLDAGGFGVDLAK